MLHKVVLQLVATRGSVLSEQGVLSLQQGIALQPHAEPTNPLLGTSPFLTPPFLLQGKRILVIDDSPTVRKIFETCLKRAGYQVRSFPDGVGAIRWLTTREASIPDLILLDIVLPRMDGYEVARYFKARPQFSQMIIVMVTRRNGMLDKLK